MSDTYDFEPRWDYDQDYEPRERPLTAMELRNADLKPCRSPYCECDVGGCTHPGFYDARGSDDLDDDDPLWLVNEQIKGLLVGDGAGEDHENVVKFLSDTGLPKATVDRIHRAIVSAEKRKK